MKRIYHEIHFVLVLIFSCATAMLSVTLNAIRRMARSNIFSATAIELDFIRFWTPFVRVFQFFCASHYSIFCRESRDRRIKCHLLRLAFCAQIAFTFGCIYLHFRMGMAISIYTIESTSSIFAYVNNVSYYCYFISNFLFPLETFAMRRTEQQIYATMCNIDAIFQQKLNHVIDYRVHRHCENFTLFCRSDGAHHLRVVYRFSP